MTSPIALRGLALVAACAIFGPAEAQDPGDLERLRQHALELVNEARAEEGLSELSLSPALNEAAQAHAEDMVERDFYSHVGPDGRTPFDRFRAAGGSRWALSGENIATCAGCSPPPDLERLEKFQNGWMQSPEHRENILSEGFDRFGFGIAGERDEIYAVQTFAGPGEEAGAAPIDDAEARAVVIDEINARREAAGLGTLDSSEALDAAAERLLERRVAGEDTPKSIFDLLPDGSRDWTSLSVLSGSRGGSGSNLSEETVVAFIDDWTEQGTDAAVGGTGASHLGFAATTRDNGRTTAVAIFGGRG